MKRNKKLLAAGMLPIMAMIPFASDAQPSAVVGAVRADNAVAMGTTAAIAGFPSLLVPDAKPPKPCKVTKKTPTCST